MLSTKIFTSLTKFANLKNLNLNPRFQTSVYKRLIQISKNVSQARYFSKGIPVATFSWETLESGKDKKIMSSEERSLIVQSPEVFVAPKDDDNLIVFENMPLDFEFHKQEAARRGLYGFFVQRPKNIMVLLANSYRQDPSNSVITVEFVPATFDHQVNDQEEIKKYIDDRKHDFFLRLGHFGIANAVKLAPSATESITDRGLAYGIYRLNGELIEGSIHVSYKGFFSIVIKTAKGFWEVKWHANQTELEECKDTFYEIVRNIRLKSKDEMKNKKSLSPAPQNQISLKNLFPINGFAEINRDQLNVVSEFLKKK